MKKHLIVFLLMIIFCLNAAAALAAPIEVYFNDPYHKEKDRTIQNMILNDIKRAKKTIDIATYNYTDTKTAQALIDAVHRGVKVRMVIDEDNANRKVINQLHKGGVSIVAAQSSGLMHAKYIIIDGKIVISGSANMTLASFSDDNNFMIRMESPEAAKVFTAEFEEMFLDLIFGEKSPKTKAAPSIKLDDGTTVYIRFSPDDGIDDMIESLIKAANDSIYILAYSFASRDIAERLQAADRDGLDVIVICEDSKAYTDGGGQCGPLAESGLDVYVDGFANKLMHEKVIILDNSVVIAGSYNFTRSADKRNDEQVLVIQSRDIANLFLGEFDKILEEAK
jgi:phosphatidylserine/phosphatidylglycerophosphate/cardiolipin synthase-like enzyme